MEGYNNKPEMLFVLRMNAEGNDVFIEEYELSEFPKLEEWFYSKGFLIIMRHLRKWNSWGNV